jgi:hypothetical protein
MTAKGTFPRSLKRLPGHSLRVAQTTPYRLIRRGLGAIPATYFGFCAVLSYWLNQQDGDCVTAEQCYNIDLASTIATGTGYVVSDNDVLSFARKYGLLNGADLAQVDSIMQTNGLPTSDGKLFKVGATAAVDWTNYEEVCAATIEAKGSLQMAIAAGQLESAADDSKVFNYAFNFSQDGNADHCTGLGAGYGTAQQCLDALNAFYTNLLVKHGKIITCRLETSSSGEKVWRAQTLTSFSPQSLPSGVDPNTPSFVMFSWNRLWIISAQSVTAITDEMYIRQPSSIMTTNPNPGPGPSPAPQHPTRRGLALGIELADLQAEGHSVFVESELARLRSNIDSYRLQRSLAKKS